MKTKLVNILAVAIAMVLPVTTRLSAQSAYFQAITNLNPVGYWPMHEVETAAPGDIETNYGTLGLLGTGFYPDWAGATVGIKRGMAGALANDSDGAVYFTFGGSPGAGTFTNVLLIPHISPLLTLNPPFSVECWVYPTNQNNESIWSSSGFEGLNAGGLGAGAGQIAGITLQWNGTNTGFQVYSYYNSTTLNTEGNSGNVNNPNNTPLNHWYHVVVTCDASTNMNLYVNNVQGLYVLGSLTYNVSGFGLYTPDYWSAFQVGGGRGDTRALPGYLDEIAIYTNVLGDIATHYNDGIGGAAGAYFHDVTNDNPIVYLRMDAAAAYTPPSVSSWPVLTNYGATNGVSVGNGVYTPGTMPGAISSPPVNPNGVPFGGVASNLAALSGVGTYADVGYAAAYNPIGPVPFSVTALFHGNPCDGRMNTIVGHSDNSWNLSLNTTGHLFWRFGTNTTANLTSAGVYNDGKWHQVEVVYTPNSNPALPGTNALYVDGALDILTNNASVNGFLPGTNSDVLIGSDPQYTNSPAGAGRSFAGQICDVAIFGQALSLAQIQTLYNASGVVPYITSQPTTVRVVNGGVGTYIFFGVVAGGSSPLAYQWYFNTTSNYSGATQLANDGVHYFNINTSNMTVTNLTATDSGYYFAVIANNAGSVTSRLASLAINTAVQITGQFPVPYTNLFTLFAGASPTFSIIPSGTPPYSYQWFTNGVLDGVATSSNFTWSSVSQGTLSNYCIVGNAGGSATSMVWAPSVIPAPTAPYPTNVLAMNPVDYWRLNESDDNQNDGNPGALCHDYLGGNDGIYTNVILSQGGYSASDPETSAEFGQFGSAFFEGILINNYVGQIQGVDFATAAGSNGEFSVEAWVNGYAGGQVISGAIATKGYYNSSDQFNLGVDSTHLHFRFYVRDASGNVHIVGSGFAPAMDDSWHHLVGVCDEANGQLILYYDGKLVSAAAIPTNSGVYEVSSPMSIGAATADGVNYTNQFSGFINDVVVYKYALSISQVMAQYQSVSTNVLPYFSPPPPTSVSLSMGGVLSIPATAIGTPPLSYQWYDVSGGTNVASGSTNGISLNASLTVSNVPGAWNGDQFELMVNGAGGSTNVYVILNVLTNAPQIIQGLPSPVNVVSGRSYVYSIGASGVMPFGYQWYNGATLISGQTNSTLTVTAGSPGSTSYYVVITNVTGSATSSVSTFTSIPQLTGSYAANILQFNPVGYWPLQETNSPAPVAMETNYGTLGSLGNAYYSATNASVVNFAQTGVLAGDADPAAAVGVGQVSYAFVPRFSPAMTIKAPFSVEAWVNQSNSTYGIIVGEGGGEGLNGNQQFGGFQMGFGSVSGANEAQMLYYTGGNNTSTQFNDPSNCPVNTWYHEVATYDGTNSISYLDGYPMVTGVVTQVPDLGGAPLTIGNGKWTTTGGQRQIGAIIDEVAVYTNVLSANRVAQHYNAGIDPTDYGTYVTNILADQPLLYYRMDCAGFTNPPENICPEAVNYGSAPVEGFYLRGIVPGGVSGPISNNVAAAPINGLISCVDAGNDPSFNPTGTNPFTAMCWFKGNPADGRLQTIMGHGATNWSMNVDGSSGHLVLTTVNGSLASSAIINDGNWHFVAGVDNGAGVYLYVDGQMDTAAPLPGTNGLAGEPNAHLYLGGNADFTQVGNNQQYLSGAISQAALFTNAISATQIQEIYSQAVPVTASTNPTNILFSASGNNLTLSWPADHTGWQLQSQTNSLAAGIGTNWVNVNGTTGTNQISIPINLTNGSVFYRLIYP